MEDQNFETGLTAERESVVGDRTPQIEFVRNATTNSANTYTPGGVLMLIGENLKIDVWGNSALGAYLIDSAGTQVRSASYVVSPEGTNAFFVVPKDLVGPQKVRLKTVVDENADWVTYHTPLAKEEG